MGHLPYWPDRQSVEDLVPNCGGSALFSEAMSVDPARVGAFRLFVYESERGVPQRNPRSPREGKTEKAQAIIDLGSFGHLDGLECCNVKVELWRGYALKIGCFTEKGKNRLDIERQAHGRPENMSQPVRLFTINVEIKRNYHKGVPLHL
jgi:hypothetical protein